MTWSTNIAITLLSPLEQMFLWPGGIVDGKFWNLMRLVVSTKFDTKNDREDKPIILNPDLVGDLKSLSILNDISLRELLYIVVALKPLADIIINDNLQMYNGIVLLDNGKFYFSIFWGFAPTASSFYLQALQQAQIDFSRSENSYVIHFILDMQSQLAMQLSIGKKGPSAIEKLLHNWDFGR